MHGSPLHDMRDAYDWHLTEPGERLAVRSGCGAACGKPAPRRRREAVGP